MFRFASRDRWYACENLCPHKREMVLARGILGEQEGTPKVACPMHKKTFSLESGQCLSGEDYKVRVFPVKIEMGAVFVSIPHEAGLDAASVWKTMRYRRWPVPFPVPDAFFLAAIPEP